MKHPLTLSPPLIALSLLLLVLSHLPGSALAAGRFQRREPQRVEIRWRAPRACSSKVAMQREIRRLLSRSKNREPIVVSVAIEKDAAAAYRLELLLETPVAGKRTLVHHDCRGAARAAALIVAMAVDADAVAQAAPQQTEPQSEPQPELGAAAVSAAEPAAPETPPETPPSPAVELEQAATAPTMSDGAARPDEWRLWLSTHFESAVTPTLALGPVLGAGFGRGWLHIDAAVGTVPRSTATVQDSGARFELWLAELSGCAELMAQRVTGAFCIAARQHWIEATGRGVDDVLNPRTTVFAFAAGPLLDVQIAGPLHAELALQALLPLQRPLFVIDNLEQTVFRPGQLGVTGRLGLVLRL